jgi:hypothetical protein
MRRDEHLEATVARDDNLDELVAEITVDAHGDEGYWSFLQAFEDEVSFPLAALLAGMPVVVTGLDFDGDERRGLGATVEHDGASAAISVLALDLTAGTDPAVSRLVAAYRRWLAIT